jgi:hypothetical protein
VHGERRLAEREAGASAAPPFIVARQVEEEEGRGEQPSGTTPTHPPTPPPPSLCSLSVAVRLLAARLCPVETRIDTEKNVNRLLCGGNMLIFQPQSCELIAMVV